MAELSKLETEIMRLLIKGATNTEVTQQLSTRLRTLESWRQKIKRKLGASSSVQLGYLFAKYELVVHNKNASQRLSTDSLRVVAAAARPRLKPIRQKGAVRRVRIFTKK